MHIVITLSMMHVWGFYEDHFIHIGWSSSKLKYPVILFYRLYGPSLRHKILFVDTSLDLCMPMRSFLCTKIETALLNTKLSDYRPIRSHDDRLGKLQPCVARMSAEADWAMDIWCRRELDKIRFNHMYRSVHVLIDCLRVSVSIKETLSRRGIMQTVLGLLLCRIAPLWRSRGSSRRVLGLKPRQTYYTSNIIIRSVLPLSRVYMRVCVSISDDTVMKPPWNERNVSLFTLSRQRIIIVCRHDATNGWWWRRWGSWNKDSYHGSSGNRARDFQNDRPSCTDWHLLSFL